MMATLSRTAAAMVTAMLLLAPAAAQNRSPVLSLEGKVKHPQHLTLSDARKLPAQHADVAYETDGGPAKGSFTGVSLWSLIVAAGGIDDTGHGVEVRHPIRITATDGYIVVTSTGEIAPDIGGKPALLAYERDGKPLDNFWLVMPGDKHDGRYVHDVVKIVVE